jgi:agmatine/peptidylarginine deiminase
MNEKEADSYLHRIYVKNKKLYNDKKIDLEYANLKKAMKKFSTIIKKKQNNFKEFKLNLEKNNNESNKEQFLENLENFIINNKDMDKVSLGNNKEFNELKKLFKKMDEST